LLGYPTVTKNIVFNVISLLPLEMRGSAKVVLDRNGRAIKPGDSRKSKDAIEQVSVSYALKRLHVPSRQFTDDQRLIIESSDPKMLAKDKVSLYGIRPVELLQLVRSLGKYYEWMYTDGAVVPKDEILNGLDTDITKCQWIDGLGRRIWIRKCAVREFVAHISSISESDLNESSLCLRTHLVSMLQSFTSNASSIFVFDDKSKETPTIVFTRINPQQNMKFIYHVLLQLGQYDTELDFKRHGTLREVFYRAGLFPHGSNLENFDDSVVVPHIVQLVMDYVIPPQPVGLKIIKKQIPEVDKLIESILLHNSIPVSDLPSCLSNRIFEVTKKDLEEAWNQYYESQLNSMLTGLKGIPNIPSKEEFAKAVISKPLNWSPEQIERLPIQSQESYEEQQLAMNLGINAVKQYMNSEGSDRAVKNVLINGSPGAGKTFVLQCIGLYAISMGLKVMSTSFMAVRASEIGGLNIHQLFKLNRKRKGSLFRLAEVSSMTNSCSVCG
jgi:hypothetical protein